MRSRKTKLAASICGRSHKGPVDGPVDNESPRPARNKIDSGLRPTARTKDCAARHRRRSIERRLELGWMFLETRLTVTTRDGERAHQSRCFCDSKRCGIRLSVSNSPIPISSPGRDPFTHASPRPGIVPMLRRCVRPARVVHCEIKGGKDGRESVGTFWSYGKRRTTYRVNKERRLMRGLTALRQR